MTREEVLTAVGVSYACLWGWIKDGKFPAAVEMVSSSRRAKIGWLRNEVDEWFATRRRRLPKGTKVSEIA